MVKTSKKKELSFRKKIKSFNEQIDDVEAIAGGDPIEKFPDNKKRLVEIKKQLSLESSKYGSFGKKSSRNSVIAAVSVIAGIVGISLLFFYPLMILATLTPGTMLLGAGVLMLTGLGTCSIRPLIKSIQYKRYAKKVRKAKERCEKLMNVKFVLQNVAERQKRVDEKLGLVKQDANTNVSNGQNKIDATLNKPKKDSVKFQQENNKNNNINANTQDELVLEDTNYSIANSDKYSNLQSPSYYNNDNVLNNPIINASPEVYLNDTNYQDDDVNVKFIDGNGNEITNNEVIVPDENSSEFVVSNNQNEMVSVILDPKNSEKSSSDVSKYVFSVKCKIYNEKGKGPQILKAEVKRGELAEFIEALGQKNSRLDNKLQTIYLLSKLSQDVKKNGTKIELVIHATKMTNNKKETFTSIPYTDRNQFIKIIETLRESMIRQGKKLLDKKEEKEYDYDFSYTK